MPLFGRELPEHEKRAEIERLIREEFAAGGMEGELVHDPDDPLGTRLVSPQGVWGFATPMMQALDAPPRRWRPIAREHVRRMLAPSPEPDLGTPEGLGSLRARLMPEGVLGTVPARYALPYAPGLVELLSLDLPETVRAVTDGDLEGRDVDELRAIGRRNLGLEPVGAPVAVEEGVFGFQSESLFTASQLLRPGFVDSLRSPGSRGVVVAIPDRHLLVYHDVHGIRSAEPITAIARLAASIDHDTRPGGLLSESAYFVSADGVQQVSRRSADGGVQIVADGAFGAALAD